jgi:FtsP/CotA-like multicopper oxidase with cupredoxin domain
MKRLLTLFAFLLMFSVFVAGQATPVPTCNSWSAGTAAAPSGVPVFSAAQPPLVPDPAGTPTCTDIFGAGNWANSPLPAGTITGFTLINGGSGYANPVVVITDPTGTGATATASFDSTGAITGMTGSGTNYTLPVVSVVDVGIGGTLAAPMCGGTNQPVCGSGALATAIIGAPFMPGTGMLKFQDTLPNYDPLAPSTLAGGLKLATPDTTTFPGSDFYIIGLVEYTARMHANLPPTTLRGYCQLANTTTTTCNSQSYLGPVIVAQKDRPVRVLFRNLLTPGAGGNLFIPMDSTYMGADLPQNRATLHLHGGATPWISDGTPHQWTTPEGDSLLNGPSTQPVPDMYFAGGNIVPFCTATLTTGCFTPGNPATLPTGATNTPPTGDMTFYWTNQQGGRLMFYHDHAYGITRLNVYVGEAAGYLLYDPAEETALANASAPGSVTGGDLAHLIPLVIQDKTFVPSKAQLDAQDPTWDGVFGATPLNTTSSNGNGDLWFSHVYMPNQDPADALGGGNPFGRWDYGPWFFPPMTTLTAAKPNSTDITIPCTSAAFPGQVLQSSSAVPSEGCPIIPNPSGTPESFMDTPVVNGKAYPVMHVAPAAYRFQILAAGNDRSWNLSWFQADATQGNTEVAMLPAVPPSNGSTLPLCSSINPVAVPGLVIGLATGKLDANGNPLNGTGLPANCWPNYGPQPGIPAPQTMWAADGRAGGAPDPRNAGPAWIQIGTEGGLLPAPVVIPPTPINYEQNVRSITIGSVAVHGLWLGPAERADVIVDFSQFAGKTLILYNDAPTPAPANDSRLDYFTGDGDQTPIGGAPNTPAGYGPNTRTIMQVVVDGNAPNTVPFNLNALKAAFASTAAGPGLFASTQPTTIVPEPAYNSAYNSTFPPVYAPISADTLTFNPIAPLTFEALLGINEPSACVGTPTSPTQCASLNHKAIQELFTLDYGRMNATLGTELPNVNFQNQTTIPLGYVDPATEIVRQGDTQLWKITHNGVDSHFIHFHLFNVEVINRVGWDGSLRPPDANEHGWKDTVRMNPLEDIIVALQPITPLLPWPIPNSVRNNDVTNPTPPMTNFTGLDPFSNNPAPVVDKPTNFGWEYVWHCHILGHEENDMMRPIMWQVPPNAPGNLAATSNTSGGVTLTWTDNSASETDFTIVRDTDPTFKISPTSLTIPTPNTNKNLAGEGTDWGGQVTYLDSPPPLPAGSTYYYQVQAVDNGFTAANEQSYNTTGPLLSPFSNTASIALAPFGSIAPTSLAFGNVTVGTTAGTLSNGQLAQVTISNTGNAILTVSSTQTGSNDFSSTATSCTSVMPGATCIFNVTYTPTTIGVANATITLTTNDSLHQTLSVSLSGAGIVGTAIGIGAPTVTYNANGVVTLTVTSSPTGFTPTGNVTLSVDGATPISQALVAGVAAFTITSPNAGNHTLLATYATQGGFQGSTASGTLAVSKAGLTITASSATINYGGAVPAITPSFSAFLGADNATTALTSQPTCSTTATSASVVGSYPSSCTGAVALNYAITYVGGAVTVNRAFTTTTITSNLPNPAIVGQIVTVTFSVAPQYTGTTPTGLVTVTANPTGEKCTATLPATSCNLTFATGGARTLTATYGGDSNFTGSSSAIANEVISGVSLSTSSLLFGNQLVGTVSAAQTVTLANVGTTTLTISNILWSTNFSDSNNCGGSLAPGRSCRINVRFAPTQTGVLSGTLTIVDSDPVGNGQQVVNLTGTGVQPAALLSPASLTFGPIARRASQTLPVTLQNTGTAAMTISSINFGGANPGQFSQTNNCGGTLAVGATCTINVTFSSNQRGTFTASLRVSDNAPGSPQTVLLTGTAN